MSAVSLPLRGRIEHCECGPMHDDRPRPERPLAAYVAYALPCEVSTCEGRLLCVGHGVCSDCAAAIRADRTEWTTTGNDVDLVLLHGSIR